MTMMNYSKQSTQIYELVTSFECEKSILTAQVQVCEQTDEEVVANWHIASVRCEQLKLL